MTTKTASARAGEPPGAITVTLPDRISVPAEYRGQPYLVQTLLTAGDSNAKLAKSNAANVCYRSHGLSLSPADTSGYNLCASSSPGCREACLFHQGRGTVRKTSATWIARAVAFKEHPDWFAKKLRLEIAAAVRACERAGVTPAFRLNMLSDVQWESVFPWLFTEFSGAQFYDYTKHFRRVMKFLRGEGPRNYRLVFSRSECNEPACLAVLEAGGSVDVVFRRRPLPASWHGYEVIDGDKDDLRFLDAPNVVVGLSAKGTARHDATGFVLDVPDPEIEGDQTDLQYLDPPRAGVGLLADVGAKHDTTGLVVDETPARAHSLPVVGALSPAEVGDPDAGLVAHANITQTLKGQDMKKTLQEAPQADPAPADESDARHPLVDAIVWLLRGGRPMPVEHLVEALKSCVDAELCMKADLEWAEENPESAAGDEAEAGRGERWLRNLVDAALDLLVNDEACEVNGEGGERTARLVDFGSIAWSLKASDMGSAASKAAQAGFLLVEVGRHAEEEVAERVSAAVPDQWGQIAKRLIADCAMQEIRSDLSWQAGVEEAATQEAATPAGPQIDPEFAALMPTHSPEEKAQLESNLVKAGVCRDPLIVWAGRGILLEGHVRLELCNKNDIPFGVVEVDLPDREAAKDFIIRSQLGRRNLSPRDARLWRGKVYNALKRQHGGFRDGSSDQSDHLTSTAEKLSEKLAVSPATLRREGKLAEAADRIGRECGPGAKQEILSRESGLSQQEIIELAKEEDPAGLRQAVEEAITSGKSRPEGALNGAKKARASKAPKAAADTVELPAEPVALANELFKTMGREKSRAVYEALGNLLAVKKKR